MLKNALLWILAIGIGCLGINYGLLVAALASVLVGLLAIFVPIISKRRKNPEPLDQ